MAIAASDTPDPKMMQALQGLIGTGTGGASARSVYMGDYAPKRPKGSSPQAWRNIQEQSSREDRSVWMTEDDATKDFYTWSPKQQNSFISQGVLAGLLKLGDGPLEGATLWKKFVKEAAQYGAVGKKVSPIDLMAVYKNASGGGNAWTSAGVWQINTVTGQRRYTGPGTYLGDGKAQQTDSRVDLTDPDTARAISTQLFQNLMGRDPGDGELGAFANALHSAEQSSPVVSTTTTQYDMDTGQSLGSDTTQSGGLTSDAKAYIQEQKIKGTKEYGVNQAVTTYQNAFESLIFGAQE